MNNLCLKILYLGPIPIKYNDLLYLMDEVRFEAC